jgi:hypothetical protein
MPPGELADRDRTNAMMLHDVLKTIWDVFVTIALAVLFGYMQWKRYDSRYKGLGDGGVQTLFGDKKSQK